MQSFNKFYNNSRESRLQNLYLPNLFSNINAIDRKFQNLKVESIKHPWLPPENNSLTVKFHQAKMIQKKKLRNTEIEGGKQWWTVNTGLKLNSWGKYGYRSKCKTNKPLKRKKYQQQNLQDREREMGRDVISIPLLFISQSSSSLP